MRPVVILRVGLKVAILLFGCVCNGNAQTYPAKPVRLIVPYTAGGGADSTTRLVASKVTEHFGQQVVIENRGGGGGNIGAGIAAKSPPDGYTLLLASAALSASVSIFPKLPFNALSDFTAVSLLSKTPSLLAVHPSLPVKSVKELIELARARPGQVNYAGGDVASLLHLDVEYFKAMAKINLVRVPYNGSGPSLIGVLAGEASVIMAPALLVVPHTRSGRLRALALTSIQRAPALPDLPTVTESGLPGFQAQQWYGVLAPTGVPDSILNQLNVEFGRAVKSPDLSARLIRDVSIPVGSTRTEFAQFFEQDIDKWKKVLMLSRNASGQ